MGVCPAMGLNARVVESDGKQPKPSLADAEVRALEPVLRACARRTVSNPSVIDDLVQETLLAAVAGLDAFDGRSALRTWVVSILSRKVVDHYRRSERWAARETEEDEQRLLEATSRRSPEHELSDRQAFRVLEAALGDLPAQERLAIVLADVEELDREEVCNVLGVSATHLRVILHRGRHRLRRALEVAGV